MRSSYILYFLIALVVADGYANDSRGAQAVLLACGSWAQRFNESVDSFVRQVLP